MINSALFCMGSRLRARRFGSALLVASGLLVWPVPMVKAGGMATAEAGLVAQAREGAWEVPAEVKVWRAV